LNSSGTGDYQVKAYMNSPPTLTSVGTIQGATEDVPFAVTYSALNYAANHYDADDDAIQFRVQGVLAGTLYANNSPVTNGVTLLGSGQEWMWTPPANANGTIAAFKILAYDGYAASSAEVTVNVAVAPVNDPPSIVSPANIETTAGLKSSERVVLISDIDR
jgi:hypothetical protein